MKKCDIIISNIVIGNDELKGKAIEVNKHLNGKKLVYGKKYPADQSFKAH